MPTPKPVPSKPLTFTPPLYLKGETQSSELPFVDDAESNVIEKQPQKKAGGKKLGQRLTGVIIDEAVNLDLGSPTDIKKVDTKKPFVLDERLTQRPFHDDRLMQLKNRIQRPSFKNR